MALILVLLHVPGCDAGKEPPDTGHDSAETGTRADTHDTGVHSGGEDSESDTDTDTGTDTATSPTDTGFDGDIWDLTAADAVLIGEAAGDRANYPLVGDLDGDGGDDVAVSAWNADESGTRDGVIYLVTEPPTGTVYLGDVPDYVVGTEDSYAIFAHVAFDANGDGWPDLAVRVGEEFGTAAYQSSLRVLYGPLEGRILADDAMLVVGAVSNVGSDAGFGDLDGDGVLDLAIGDSTDEYATSDTGDAAPLPGGEVGILPADTTGSTVLDFLTTRITWPGTDQVFLGTQLEVADLDGDGVSDLVTSASRTDGTAGTVFVFNGPVRGVLTTDDADGARSATDAGTHLGYLDLAVGDVDGDGAGDIAVPSACFSPRPGRVWLFSGPVTGVADVSGASATFEDDDLYTAVELVDLDADGRADVVLDAAVWGSDMQGAVALWLGPVVGHQGLEDATAWIVGDAHLNLGHDLSTGDVDGDGAIDLFAGAYPDGSTEGVYRFDLEGWFE